MKSILSKLVLSSLILSQTISMFAVSFKDMNIINWQIKANPVEKLDKTKENLQNRWKNFKKESAKKLQEIKNIDPETVVVSAAVIAVMIYILKEIYSDKPAIIREPNSQPSLKAEEPKTDFHPADSDFLSFVNSAANDPRNSPNK